MFGWHDARVRDDTSVVIRWRVKRSGSDVWKRRWDAGFGVLEAFWDSRLVEVVEGVIFG